MKLIFENWRRYLEEEQLEEKLALKKGKMGWWKYSELVAKAYRTAPDYDASVEPLYEKLGHWLEGMFGRMSSKIEIKFVPEHPYKSGKEMRQRVKDEGVMYVSTSDAEHPVWTGEQGLIWNTMFRAWHDWEGHIAKGRGFKLQGEIASYNAHAKTIPRECIPILFTEVVGQICCFYQSGKQNCGQKAMIMPEFDYINVGALTPEGEERFGYRLDPESKLLVPIDNSPAVATSEEGDELNEGVLAKTALALSTALGGVAPEDQDYDTASPDQDQTIQQVDAEKPIGELSGFWDHGENEVVNEDGQLMALGSAELSVGMTSLARTMALQKAKIKLMNHLDTNQLSGAAEYKVKTVGNTLYAIIAMPAPK